jgi:tripartite-type tricarboxylate transporter receptor subunit TctC
VPFVAGGTTDNIARLMAQRFSESLGQTVVVNNRPGGGSTIGTNAVAKAPPDGHTLLVTTIGFAINAGLQKLPYDPIGDFTPITELASLPLVLVVHASVPATNLQEFIALAKSKPGGWDYASSGTGTSPHLAAEMFKSMAGIELVHVPFKGNAEAMNSLMGGHVKIYFALVPAVLQHIKAGTLRPLAVTTEQRLPYLPDVPTIAELGFPAMRSVPGRASSRPPAPRKTSSSRSTASSFACSRCRRSMGVSRRRVPTLSEARPSFRAPREERDHQVEQGDQNIRHANLELGYGLVSRTAADRPQESDQHRVGDCESRQHRHGRPCPQGFDHERARRRRKRLDDQARKRQASHQRGVAGWDRTARAATCRARST